LALSDWLATLGPIARTFVLATLAVPIVMYGLMPQFHRLRIRVLSRLGAGPGDQRPAVHIAESSVQPPDHALSARDRAVSPVAPDGG
jgi:hypothetical protein